MKVHLALALTVLVLTTPVWGAELGRWFRVGRINALTGLSCSSRAFRHVASERGIRRLRRVAMAARPPRPTESHGACDVASGRRE